MNGSYGNEVNKGSFNFFVGHFLLPVAPEQKPS